MRIRAWALCSAAGLLLSGAALADDLTITTQVTTPVETADPAGTGGTPGDITINLGSSVIVDLSGDAAVTINSDNTVVNNGSIANTATSNAIGIHIFGGFTGDMLDDDGRPIGLTGTGSIAVLGKGADGTGTPGTGNIGILLDGPGAFTGDIDLKTMPIGMAGVGAVGVQIDTMLIGNLNLGVMNILGEGSTAVRTTAAIDGVFANMGVVNVSGVQTFDLTEPDVLAGPAFAIGADVTGGILNAGPTSDTDTTTARASVQVIGSSPAFQIAPDTASLTIGVLDDATNPGFSFINRGGIETIGADPGVDAMAIYIGRLSGDASTNTATLTGGIYNASIIRSTATSSTFNSTNHDPADADARTIVIGAGGIVSTIANSATGTISAGSDGGPKGGTATAILVQSDGSLTSIVNDGTISAIAGTTAGAEDDPVTELSATAIRDESGTLTSVTNTGSIAAILHIAQGDNAEVLSQSAIAGDFSANTTTFSFNNSGTVLGDVIFGSGTSTFTIDGDDDEDGNNLATASGSFHATGGGTLDIAVSNGTLSTSNTQAHNLNVGAEGVVNLTLPESGAPAVVSLTGDGGFAAGSRINFGYSKFLGDSASFVLVHADGTLTVDDVAGTTDATKPFLYNTTIANDGHDLTLDIARKSAGELGFTGNLEAVYEPAVAAIAAGIGTDDALGAALMRVTDEQGAVVAFQSLMPVVNGAQRNYAISLTDQFFGPVGARQRTLLTTPNQGRNLAFWGQEFYLSNENHGSTAVPGYSDSGFGIAAGADYGSLSTGRYGIAFENFNGDSVAGEPRVTKTLNNWTVFSLYADWADQDNGLFFGTQASGGFGSFDEKRRITVDDFQTIAKGHWSGWLASWGATVGDVIGDDTFAIIPQASVDALYMSEGAYRETGGGTANLGVAERSNTSIRGFLGLVGRAQFEFAGGYVRPEVHIGYSHEFSGQPADANVYFVSAQNMHFRISGPAEPVGKFIGGGSLSFVYNNWSVGGDYDRTLGSDTSSEAGSLTLSGHF